MENEIIKTESPENTNEPSYPEIIMLSHNTCHRNCPPKLTWKQTILEISQKQGYTAVAL